MHTHASAFFENVYNDQADAIFRFCLTRVSSANSAIDITQETFLRFWEAVRHNQRIENARAFLFTVARRLIIDWYRKKKSVSLDSLIEARDGQPPTALQQSGKRRTERKIEARQLFEKLGELAPTYHRILHLRFIQDRSVRDIASLLHITANAASLRISRGLKSLRKKAGYETDERPL
jgi:RNA polymerase sigma-70 factor (ECF subfamily)